MIQCSKNSCKYGQFPFSSRVWFVTVCTHFFSEVSNCNITVWF